MKYYAFSAIFFFFLFGVALAPFEVFLSSTSDDIRNSFSGHLYTALEQAGIYTFRVEDGIPTGEKRRSTTQRALEASKVAVVVFTKDSAKCIACLDQLVKIMELVKIGHLKLVPVYLYVNEMDVEEQTGPYYEAFASLERQLERKMDLVEQYRIAFTEAGKIKGPCLMNRYESKFIKEIVIEVKSVLKKAEPSYFSWNNSVGWVIQLFSWWVMGLFSIVVFKVVFNACRQCS